MNVTQTKIDQLESRVVTHVFRDAPLGRMSGAPRGRADANEHQDDGAMHWDRDAICAPFTRPMGGPNVPARTPPPRAARCPFPLSDDKGSFFRFCNA